jgi:hypothetical protein
LIERSPRVDKVALLHFRSPFFEEFDGLRELVREEWPGVSFRTQSLKKDYRRLANIPPGSPFSLKRSCLSCRTLMLARAIRYMERIKADFVVTGEILGRHGLSEVEMERITEDLGVGGLVVRPLSAQLLPPSQAEREGWIRRDSLGDLREGDRDRLAELAHQLGLSEDDPMGSDRQCKLTFPGFGKRLENLFEEDRVTLNALKLLEFEIYYKRPPDVKIVLATDEDEKRALQTFFLPQDLRVYLPTHRGPMTLVRADWTRKSPREIKEIITLAARITVTHSDAAHLAGVQVKYRFEKDNETSQLNILPFRSIAEIANHCFVSNFSSPLFANRVPLS